MSGRRSRNKGAAGEREACAELERLTGIPWERSLVQTRRGGAEAPDVVPAARGGPWDRWHVEVKRQKRPNLYAALEQAVADAGGLRLPLVLARRDRDEWVVLVRLTDLSGLLAGVEGE